MGFAPRLLAALAAALLACKGAGPHLPDGAALLFDVHFDAPENKPGAPPKVYAAGETQPFPSSIPSQIFMGQPTVVDALCGLTKQPLRLTTASGMMGHEGVEFLMSQRYGRYHVELDLCIAQLGEPPRPASEPQLAVFLDFPEAYAVGFFADGRVALIDPARAASGDATADRIGSWTANKPLHLAIDADLEQQTWSIALDGVKAHEGKFAGYLGRAVRVVVRGNESNAVAFDDFVAWGEHDLATGLQTPPEGPKVGDE